MEGVTTDTTTVVRRHARQQKRDAVEGLRSGDMKDSQGSYYTPFCHLPVALCSACQPTSGCLNLSSNKQEEATPASLHLS